MFCGVLLGLLLLFILLIYLFFAQSWLAVKILLGSFVMIAMAMKLPTAWLQGTCAHLTSYSHWCISEVWTPISDTSKQEFSEDVLPNVVSKHLLYSNHHWQTQVSIRLELLGSLHSCTVTAVEARVCSSAGLRRILRGMALFCQTPSSSL